ncbi:MAG: HsdR family type I site-specific deoxyribonuclease [Alphaproteobacteria bacterium]|nr:HsdR family type I site-specific deoxyribonuclease [Alphaproteobacteria bacterium]
MAFAEEKDFEKALIELLLTKGWEKNVLKYPTEEQLLQNWADILFENNREKNRLNDFPMTKTEMQQLIEQITALKTPFKLNEFINGKTVSITRDNPKDELHFGKEISLKIYDRMEIAAGQSRYQIVQQPIFKSKSPILNDRRGDLMLLINGMPVIHIELKRTGIPVSQACYQIEKYAHEGLFSGIFSLIQIFVAMNPEETLYFSNPGRDGRFNKDFFFHWADFNNNPINDWKAIGSTLLSIPMAHQLIGFYTIADETDGILKVMRSYQYYAASAISDKVAKTDWMQPKLLGGYIWHTTGSGKTMTSFKSAQLIADSQDADKVVFLVDRIELGTQSLKAYQNFANARVTVQGTENTGCLVTKLKSPNPADTLIVTSIQKMSRIKEDAGLKTHDIQVMNSKRIVFIVDEAHRSTFGDMLMTIKDTFPHAIFFGFTGTPILEENEHEKNTTATVFGNELHRYSIADGIRDKNVLGFDPYKVLTYADKDLRQAVALEQSKAKDVAEAVTNPEKRIIFNKYMRLDMVGHTNSAGKYVKGIEDFIPVSQYLQKKHRKAVVQDILDNWITLSLNSKFHAILATNSIKEAIQYYELIKKEHPSLKITALFDASDVAKNEKSTIFKEDGLKTIIADYNAKYNQDFSIATHAKFKKDVALRMAHKEPYLYIEKTPEKQIDLLIVVNQMLTGFDSKWLNTLYLDKKLQYENVIQAFSRTNRLFGSEKPFGTIRYYRYPHSMEANIEKAVKLYSGDKPFGLFAEKLPENLSNMNNKYKDILDLFKYAKIDNFECLPKNINERARFARLFKEFNDYLDAAKIQGFRWKTRHYEFGKGKTKVVIDVALNETTYKILALRYKELQNGGAGPIPPEQPYEIDTHLIEIDTAVIDADYMNSRFESWKKVIEQKNIDRDEAERTLNELHKSFATLTQEEQKYANIFLHDIERGETVMETGKSFRDYVTAYMTNAKNDQVSKLALSFGLDAKKLHNLINGDVNVANINEYGRFDELIDSVDKKKAKQYFEKLEGRTISLSKINIRVDKLLRDFIITGGNFIEIKN